MKYSHFRLHALLPFISSYFVLVLAIAKVVVKSIANTLSILLIKTIVNTIGKTKKVLPIVLKQYKYCNINNPGIRLRLRPPAAQRQNTVLEKS